MDLRKLLMENYPHLKEKYESEQFAYSEKLIGIKLKHKLSQLEMAEIADINYDDYLDMEACDVSIAVDQYKEVVSTLLNRLENKQ